LITGASRGLGLEITRRFLSEGWVVYGVVRNNDDALRIQKMGAISIISDVTKDAIVADIQKEITQKLSLVINNAGFVGVGEKLVNTNPDDFLKQLDVH